MKTSLERITTAWVLMIALGLSVGAVACNTQKKTASQKEVKTESKKVANVGGQEALDQDLLEAEAELERARKELSGIQGRAKREYEENPTSEQAHTIYAQELIRKRNYQEAEKVIESLKGLNPKSKSAEVLGKQIEELKALGDKRVPKEMRVRHSQEFFEAIHEDTMEQMGADMKDVMKIAEADSDSFMKRAEALHDKQKAVILKRFPNICDKQEKLSYKEIMAEVDIQSDLLNIRMKKGSEGLKEAFPEFLEKHPDSLMVTKEYAKFLMQDKDYEKLAVFVAESRKKFPKDVSLQLIDEALKEAKGSRSVEAKEGRMHAVQNQLMTLSMVEGECEVEE